MEALRKIYSGPRNPRTGAQIYPGYPPGTEAGPGGWSAWIAPAEAEKAIQFRFGNTYYGQAVFEDPKWNFRTLNFDSDVAFGDQKAGDPLSWEDARAAVFHTALLMYEYDRLLNG